MLAGASQLLTQALGDPGDVEEATRLVPDSAGGWELAAGGLLLLAWALSVAGSLVTFAGFTVTRDGERLRIRRGLLQRSEAAVPVRRVHGVRVVEGVLRRPFGLCTVRVEVAGYAAEAAAARTLFPLLRRADVEPFLADLLPELADDPTGLAPPPKRAARRYVLPVALLGAALGGAACLAFPAIAPWPLLAAPLFAARRLAGLPGGRLAAARRAAGDQLAAARVVDAARPGVTAAAARDRAEPVPAPGRARRPRGGGRQGRPRPGPPPRRAGGGGAVGAAAAVTAGVPPADVNGGWVGKAG